MRKLIWIVGGGVGGFALAVFVMRFVLATGGDTTIRLATSAPAIPGVAEGSPAAAAGAASNIDSAPQANASAQETGSTSAGQVASSAAAGPPAAKPAASTADGPFHFKADPAQSLTKILVT